MNDSGRSDDPTRLTRTVATLVLVPTVPLLLLSVAALALFYLAPGRFGTLLAQLPGDEVIRTVLIFAPATLFAVVVLAILYALDRPHEAPAPAEKTGEAVARRLNAARLAKWGLLAPGLPLLVLAVGMWLFSFVAPSRFAVLLGPLPGDAYLRQALRFAPLAALALVVPAALFLLLGGGRHAADPAQASARRPVRWGVGLTLLATVPLLGFSLAALGLFYLNPERFQVLLAQLTQESFIRLALVFAPAVLLSLVLLAVLFLFFSRTRGEESAVADQADAAQLQLERTRQSVALWVLTGGLAGSAVVALGLLAVAILLLLR